MEGFKAAGDLFDKSKFKKRPKYTLILHDVREKLDISANTYMVIDSIHKLSTSDHNFPFCVMSKPNMAEFLDLGERTVFRCLKEAEEKGLIERYQYGLRATAKWINTVEIYDIRK